MLPGRKRHSDSPAIAASSSLSKPLDFMIFASIILPSIPIKNASETVPERSGELTDQMAAVGIDVPTSALTS